MVEKKSVSIIEAFRTIKVYSSAISQIGFKTLLFFMVLFNFSLNSLIFLHLYDVRFAYSVLKPMSLILGFIFMVIILAVFFVVIAKIGEIAGTKKLKTQEVIKKNVRRISSRRRKR